MPDVAPTYFCLVYSHLQQWHVDCMEGAECLMYSSVATRRRGTESVQFVCESPQTQCNSCRDIAMLMTVAVVLLVLWLLGLVSAYTMGGFIHVLLVLAIVVFLVQVIQGRKVV